MWPTSFKFRRPYFQMSILLLFDCNPPSAEVKNPKPQAPNIVVENFRRRWYVLLCIRIWILFDLRRAQVESLFVIWCLACDELSRVEFPQSV